MGAGGTELRRRRRRWRRRLAWCCGWHVAPGGFDRRHRGGLIREHEGRERDDGHAKADRRHSAHEHVLIIAVTHPSALSALLATIWNQPEERSNHALVPPAVNASEAGQTTLWALGHQPLFFRTPTAACHVY